jgi:Flp pilus assembly protein TadG
MNARTCLDAVAGLLAVCRQVTGFGANLPSAKDKLQRSCRSYRRNRRGAAAVEFAVVAPVFFLLVFGMIEYGRMVMVQQVITNASREGARKAVLDGSTTAEVKTVVNEYLASGSITPSGDPTTVSPNPPSTAEFGEPVTVTVSIPFNEVSWLPSPMYLGGKTLTATTVMRRESVQ